MRSYIGIPSPEPIFRALKEFKKNNIHIEITDLIVPLVGDSMGKVKELVKWIEENLGIYTPIHFLKFFPHHKVTDLPPTPIETLEKAFRIAKDMGMQYVYLGNVVDDRNNTYCPNCRTLLIKRGIMEAPKINLKDLNCPDCGETINIRGMNFII